MCSVNPNIRDLPESEAEKSLKSKTARYRARVQGELDHLGPTCPAKAVDLTRNWLGPARSRPFDSTNGLLRFREPIALHLHTFHDQRLGLRLAVLASDGASPLH